MDPSSPEQDHTNILKSHALSGVLFTTVMSFSPLKVGALTPYHHYFFLFLTMEHQLGVCGEIASPRLFKPV